MMNDARVKVLILGGRPIASVDIVRYVQSLGGYTIVCDYLPVAQSPAKLLADEVWDYSTSDTEKIVEKARSSGVDAVFTGVHDFNIFMCCKVAGRLGLPFYATLEQLHVTTNKKNYKELFKKYNIPVVPDVPVELESAEHDAQKIKYPVLIKPSDGSGGYGISVCDKPSEFLALYKKAAQFSKNNEVLVEEFVQDSEVTIFYVIQNGEIMLSAMADRHVTRGEERIAALPTLYEFPSKHLALYQKTLHQRVCHLFHELGLMNGVVFIQSFIRNDEFMFYDMGFRLTGTQEYHLLEYICHFNPLKMMVDHAMGRGAKIERIAHLVDPWLNNQKAAILTFLARPGRIGHYIGLSAVEQMNGVVKVIKNYEVRDVIARDAIGTLNQVVLRVLATASTESALNTLMQRVTATIQVLDEHGVSMLLPTFKSRAT